MSKRQKKSDSLITEGLYSSRFEHDACGVAFVAHMKGVKSHDIVAKAVKALENLEHRGACGCETNTGDGAGILMQMPHEFMVKVAREKRISLPEANLYAAGLMFFPRDQKQRDNGLKLLEKTIKEQGLVFLGFRDVPADDSIIGHTAHAVMPIMKQIFVGLGPNGTGLPGPEDEAFERRLYILRKVFSHAVRKSRTLDQAQFYIVSLSSKTLIYKGMLNSSQLGPFFPDLADPGMKSALALVHSRFSTNTFPNWELAHPFRYICHNGEINTLRGNINWMRAREALFESPLFGSEIKRIIPIIREHGSDSATFDNALEMLVMSGRSLPHAIMMMIPEAWSGHETMSQEKKDFYEYHSCLMEPWDGPASIAFTDGKVLGAVLDRNGLRPSRYYVTKDDLVIMASEVGVLDIPADRVLVKGRLQPGRMFLVDLEAGRIVDDNEIKQALALEKPYGKWLKDNLVRLEELPAASHVPATDHETIRCRQMAFGYTEEELRVLMVPMAVNGEEATGSMGNDAQLAVLSEKPQSLFNYFKQLFAQVTNPPLDAIREELVTSVETTIGPERNLLSPEAESCHQIKLASPVLDNDQLARLKQLSTNPYRGFKSTVLPMMFKTADGKKGLEQSLNQLFKSASKAIKDGANILILSDRGATVDLCPIPSLLATAGLHHHLVREGTRTRVGLVVEAGDVREIHHFALLIGYGAGAVNPYLALESLDDLVYEGILPPEMTPLKAVTNYIKAVKKGIVKVMSKVGISTIQSYRGAQIFEAIGLNSAVIDAYFTHTATRIGGIGLDGIAREILERFAQAYPKRVSTGPLLNLGGEYQWRRGGTHHLFNPDTIAKLQHATGHGSFKDYAEFAKLINDQSKNLCTLRGLIQFKKSSPIPLEEVEPVTQILRRFKTGAMSYGSISKEAHETLAIAMNRIGGKSNTGEGGEDPERYKLMPNGDSKNSAIKQVASARFGVTSEYLVQARELQIKVAQGAKPGEGGQLPGHKVYPWIAKVRLSTPGVALISPPPHHDIYSIEDLAQLIFDLKNANTSARISVKLVAEVGVGTVAAGVAKAHADVVVIAGHDGGTGASPQTSIKHAGAPWELGLAETQQTLVRNKLRDRIVVEVDGQMKTGRDVAIGALLGAEEFGFATAPLITLGCIMMRACHLNTCPVGIATQDPVLRKKFEGTPEAVVKYFTYVAEELRVIMSELGFRTLDEMIGRSDVLDFNDAIGHWKSKGLDFTAIFARPQTAPGVAIRQITEQDHGLTTALDHQLIAAAGEALEKGRKVQLEFPICNRNRTVGTMLGSEVSRRYGSAGLPSDTISISFSGSAGQSFGAFIPKGMTLTLTGDANDYVGKGLSGGKIIVAPPKESPFIAEENILIGNVVLYGATSGEAYFRGVAGERFCVRNSGAMAVVEGVGDHGCEYMTGGRVVVLGKTGRNFAAGMSGGVAYIFDPEGTFKVNCNKTMVALETLEKDDVTIVKKLIENHVRYTGSDPAKKILAHFDASLFIKVMPSDYKLALVEVRQRMKDLGVTESEAMYG